MATETSSSQVQVQLKPAGDDEPAMVRIRKTLIQQLAACGMRFTPPALAAVNAFIDDVQDACGARVQQLERDADAMRAQRAALHVGVQALGAQFADSLRKLLLADDGPHVQQQQQQAEGEGRRSPHDLVGELVRWLHGRDVDDVRSVRPQLQHLVTVLVAVCPDVALPLLNDDIHMGCGLQPPVVQQQQPAAAAFRPASPTQPVLKFKHYLHLCCERLNDNGDRAIHLAVMAGDVEELQRECVALRLQLRSVDVANDDDLTPLHLAVVHDADEACVAALLRYGARYDRANGDDSNALHLAAERGNLERLLRCLAARDVVVEARCLNKHNADGLTPLHLAAIHNRRAAVALLAQMHAIDLDARDKKSGRTAIYHAAELDYVPIVRLLMESGASVHVKTYAGVSIVEALCDSDADYSNEMRKLFYTERIAFAKTVVVDEHVEHEDGARRKRRKT